MKHADAAADVAGVVGAAETSVATTEALAALGRRTVRMPVTVQDSPGFLVNMGGGAYTTEGLRLDHERAATPAQIDAIMRRALLGLPVHTEG